ncbi:hypothetical protein ABT116_30295 [Streptomyces sp. NPDC002130]|uniref:hypothetical protein n=1 Tax=Streptomyces sp. NPDC002130 TaxID=3155568 RepID=UPI00331D9CCD
MAEDGVVTVVGRPGLTDAVLPELSWAAGCEVPPEPSAAAKEAVVPAARARASRTAASDVRDGCIGIRPPVKVSWGATARQPLGDQRLEEVAGGMKALRDHEG